MAYTLTLSDPVEPLRTKFSHVMDVAEEERADLGMHVPDDYTVRVALSRRWWRHGAASPQDRCARLYLIPPLYTPPHRSNTGRPKIAEELDGASPHDMLSVQAHLSFWQATIPFYDGTWARRVLEEEEDALDAIDDELQRQWEQVQDPYDSPPYFGGTRSDHKEWWADSRDELVDDAHRIADALDAVQDAVVAYFEDVDILDHGIAGTARHELDHLSFYDSALHERYPDGVDLHTLDAYQRQSALIECRGWLFSAVRPGRLAEASPETLSSHVLDMYRQQYVDSWKQEAGTITNTHLDALMDGEEGKSTRRAVRDAVRTYGLERPDWYLTWDVPHSEDALSDGHEPVVSPLLESELPAWRERVLDYAETATGAYTTALQEDPARFSDMQEAEGFEEAVRILQDGA